MATKKTTAAEETTQKAEPKTTKKKAAPKKKPVTDPVPEKDISIQPEEKIIQKEEKPKPAGKTYTVRVKTKLNVRAGAGKNNKIIRQLEDGTTVTVTAEKDGWAEISPNNWVDKTFLK